MDKINHKKPILKILLVLAFFVFLWQFDTLPAVKAAETNSRTWWEILRDYTKPDPNIHNKLNDFLAGASQGPETAKPSLWEGLTSWLQGKTSPEEEAVKQGKYPPYVDPKGFYILTDPATGFKKTIPAERVMNAYSDGSIDFRELYVDKDTQKVAWGDSSYDAITGRINQRNIPFENYLGKDDPERKGYYEAPIPLPVTQEYMNSMDRAQEQLKTLRDSRGLPSISQDDGGTNADLSRMYASRTDVASDALPDVIPTGATSKYPYVDSDGSLVVPFGNTIPDGKLPDGSTTSKNVYGTATIPQDQFKTVGQDADGRTIYQLNNGAVIRSDGSSAFTSQKPYVDSDGSLVVPGGADALKGQLPPGGVDVGDSDKTLRIPVGQFKTETNEYGTSYTLGDQTVVTDSGSIFVPKGTDVASDALPIGESDNDTRARVRDLAETEDYLAGLKQYENDTRNSLYGDDGMMASQIGNRAAQELGIDTDIMGSYFGRNLDAHERAWTGAQADWLKQQNNFTRGQLEDARNQIEEAQQYIADQRSELKKQGLSDSDIDGLLAKERASDPELKDPATIESPGVLERIKENMINATADETESDTGFTGVLKGWLQSVQAPQEEATTYQAGVTGADGLQHRLNEQGEPVVQDPQTGQWKPDTTPDAVISQPAGDTVDTLQITREGAPANSTDLSNMYASRTPSEMGDTTTDALPVWGPSSAATVPQDSSSMVAGPSAPVDPSRWRKTGDEALRATPPGIPVISDTVTPTGESFTDALVRSQEQAIENKVLPTGQLPEGFIDEGTPLPNPLNAGERLSDADRSDINTPNFWDMDENKYANKPGGISQDISAPENLLPPIPETGNYNSLPTGEYKNPVTEHFEGNGSSGSPFEIKENNNADRILSEMYKLNPENFQTELDPDWQKNLREKEGISVPEGSEFTVPREERILEALKNEKEITNREYQKAQEDKSSQIEVPNGTDVSDRDGKTREVNTQSDGKDPGERKDNTVDPEKEKLKAE